MGKIMNFRVGKKLKRKCRILKIIFICILNVFGLILSVKKNFCVVSGESKV